MHPRKKYILAITALVLACSLWGATFLFAKLALKELPVSQVVLYRFALASLALLPVALLHRSRPRRQDLPLFLLVGALTVPGTFLVQFAGVALTSVASAALVIGTLPLLLTLAGTLFLHERLSRRGWLAVGMSIIGVILLIGWPSDHHWLGDGLVFVSLLAVVAWTLLSKQLLTHYSALDATAFILTAGTLVLLPFSLLWDGPPRFSLSPLVWISILALGLACTALTFVLWNWGLQFFPASRTGIYTNLEPLVGAILGVTLLGDTLSVGTVLGGLLIIASSVVVSWQEATIAQPVFVTMPQKEA